MSSRNAYLTPPQRQQALSLWQSLQLAERLVAGGNQDVADLTKVMQQHFSAAPDLEVEYIAFVEAGTVQSVSTISGPTVILIAARIDKTRLIDNHLLG